MSSLMKRSLDYACRMVLVVSLVMFGAIVTKNSVSLSKDYSALSLSDQGDSLLEELKLVNIESGYWSFTNSELAIQRTKCTQAELERQIIRLMKIETIPGNAFYDATQLVELAKLNGAKKADHPVGIVWTLQDSKTHLKLVVSNTEQPTLVAGMLALDRGGSFELTTIKARQLELGHLLPLPIDAQTICSRIDDTGKLQLEFVTTSSTGKLLLMQWQNAGWDLSPTPWQANNSLSCICTKGNQSIYAWSESESDSIMMLSRVNTSRKGARKSYNELVRQK